MKLSYPSLSEASQNDSALALRIARHSSCTICDPCSGLRPPVGVEVVLDDDAQQKSLLGDLTQYGSDEEDNTAYLETCICSHDVADHCGQVSALGREEFSRRARLATRLDKHLQVCLSRTPHAHTDKRYAPRQEAGRLLDFDYKDEVIDSLKQQMKIPVSMVSVASPSIRTSFILILPITSSSLSEHSSPRDPLLSPTSSVLSDEPPPSKRRRLSSSSLSDAEEEDDDDEDKPLAAQVADLSVAIGTSPRKAGAQRSGKKTSSMTSKSQTAPTGDKGPGPEKNGAANGRSFDLKVKVEDKMDEGQLTRLATGVAVDTGPASSTVVSLVSLPHL
jgi:histone acetyltransferase